MYLYGMVYAYNLEKNSIVHSYTYTLIKCEAIDILHIAGKIISVNSDTSRHLTAQRIFWPLVGKWTGNIPTTFQLSNFDDTNQYSAICFNIYIHIVLSKLISINYYHCFWGSCKTLRIKLDESRQLSPCKRKHFVFSIIFYYLAANMLQYHFKLSITYFASQQFPTNS